MRKRRLFMITILSVMLMSSAAYAADVNSNEVMTGMTNLKVFVFGVISLVGFIWSGFNIAHLSSAIGDRDTTSAKDAGMKLAGSLMMVFVGPIAALLGIS